MVGSAGALPIGHVAHWAALLYAAPVILLGIWAGWAKFSASRSRRRLQSGSGRTDSRS